MKNNHELKEANKSIIALQKNFVPLVNEMSDSNGLCFRTAFAKSSGNGHNWEPTERISGKFLQDYFRNDLEWAIEQSKKMCDDYQKVIAEYQKKEGAGDLLEEGRKWTFLKLQQWSTPIIKAGLIEQGEINKLSEELEKVIDMKQDNFFGWFHGNIIGDHVLVGDDQQVYLFGMRIVPRPGKGYYDFLRALDWLFLKSPNEKDNFEEIQKWMEEYFSDFEKEEVRLVFALRCAGILGWDMLHRGDFGIGDKDEKIKYLLKFIRREY